MLTSRQARERLGIKSDKTLRKLILSGELKASKIGGGQYGGSYRIAEEEIDRYLERRAVKVTTP